MKTNLLNATAAILFGVAVLSYSAAVQAEESDINNPESPLYMQIAENPWSPNDYANFGLIEPDANLAETYDMTDPEYPMDGPEGEDS